MFQFAIGILLLIAGVLGMIILACTTPPPKKWKGILFLEVLAFVLGLVLMTTAPKHIDLPNQEAPEQTGYFHSDSGGVTKIPQEDGRITLRNDNDFSVWIRRVRQAQTMGDKTLQIFELPPGEHPDLPPLNSGTFYTREAFIVKNANGVEIGLVR